MANEIDLDNLVYILRENSALKVKKSQLQKISKDDTLKSYENGEKLKGVKSMTILTTDLEEFEIPEDEEVVIEDESGGSLKFAFIGLGQCGGRIAEAFYNLGYKKNFIINTAKQDLEKNTVPNKMLIQLEGMPGGAGKDMMLAKKTMESQKESIYNKMSDLFGIVDHVFICAGLGGGTGGGSIEPLIEITKRYMKYIDVPNADRKVGAIVTLPTQGEASSPLVAGNAYEKGNQLSDLADMEHITPLIIVDNDKVKNLYKKLTVSKFFPTINNSVAQLLHVFNTIALEPSEYISFDSTDFQSILETGGHMIMGVATVRSFESKTSISEALKKNLSKTLLASNFDLERAKAVACIVIGGKDIFESIEGLMNDIELGFDTLSNFTGNAKVHRGIYSDEDRNGRLNVYTLISGLEKPSVRYEKMKPLNYGKNK